MEGRKETDAETETGNKDGNTRRQTRQRQRRRRERAVRAFVTTFAWVNCCAWQKPAPIISETATCTMMVHHVQDILLAAWWRGLPAVCENVHCGCCHLTRCSDTSVPSIPEVCKNLFAVFVLRWCFPCTHLLLLSSLHP